MYFLKQIKDISEYLIIMHLLPAQLTLHVNEANYLYVALCLLLLQRSNFKKKNYFLFL